MRRLKVVSPRCTRYYLDGKRVTREAYDAAAWGRTLECLRTDITDRGRVTETIRYYSTVRT